MSATIPRRFLIAAAVVLGAVTIAYSNHFQNSFQFDDFHVIVENPFVQSLGNIPRFFTDPVTQSSRPVNRNWRPLVMTTLAIDYWLGGGMEKTFFFHLSTFLWYLAQLLLMYLLFAAILNRTRPDPLNFWIAWFAAALYGLHPVMADTVNYVVQRAETLSAVGLAAGLAVYIRFPEQRRRGYYLAPLALATLAKAPALVFPVLLLAYIYLFEERRFASAARQSLPAFAVAAALGLLHRAMTPPTFQATTRTFSEYAPTQPFVMLRYLRSFVAPLHLSLDTDLGVSWTPSPGATIAGFLGLAALLAAIYMTARRAPLRPIAFGLIWFIVTLAPTSLYPLAELENDHRMFIPFIGLTLAVVWAGAQVLLREAFWRKNRTPILAGLACLLAVSAFGAHRRNTVWRDSESLWRDVIEKSPGNGRAYSDYGIALSNRGEFAAAVPYLQRAAQLLPAYPLNYAALGVALGGVGRDREAEASFRRAIELNPQNGEVYFYYARWLNQRARAEEAVAVLLAAVQANPTHLQSRYLLMAIYADHGVWKELAEAARECLAINPNDSMASQYLQMEAQTRAGLAGLEKEVRGKPTPEGYLRLSTQYHQAGRYNDCIAAAQEAVKLRPGYAEAYNNMAAAYASMQQWDNVIAAAREALRYKPDFAFAKKNLELALAEKGGGGGGN